MPNLKEILKSYRMHNIMPDSDSKLKELDNETCKAILELFK